ncbi:MAG: PAS domain-containing protein [Verrucomicrobia bacterium]|nr:PAS domain-containing protein [Verrucomicrobiota bacterium]
MAAAEFAAVLLLDDSGRVTFAAEAARALWQVRDEEITGEAFSNLFYFEVVSDEPDWLAAQWEVILATALNRSATLSAQPREGAPRDVLVRLERLAAGGYLATVQPPAPAPAPSAEDGSSFQLLADKGTAGFFELNLRTGRADYSPAWKKILGYVDAELPDTLDMWRQLIHPDDSSAAPDQLGRKLTVGTRPFSVEFRMKHRLGHWVWVQCLGVQVLSATGELERVVGLHIDISERKEIEESSLANDERMQLLSGAGPLGAFDLDFHARHFWVSQAWQEILGHDDDPEPADPLAAFTAALPADEAEAGPAAWLLARAPGQPTFSEALTFQGKEGVPVSVLFAAHRSISRRGELTRVTGFISALPESVPAPAAAPIAAPAATAAPTAPEGGLPAPLTAELFGVMSEGVLLVDARGKVITINPVAARLLKTPRESAPGRAVSEIFPLVNRTSGRTSDDPCSRALTANAPLSLISDDALAPAAEGEAARPIVWTARPAYDAAGRPEGIVIVFRDPEEMSLTPEELVRANRFESLGLLAGGIAHDFNNLLTTILGGLSMAKDNRDYSALADSEKACDTAKGLTRQLLAFAKGGTGVQTVASSKEILEDAVKIAASGSPAVVKVEVAETTDPVLVDRAQILQVFQNLVVNALQAMPPEPHRPALHLRAGNVKLAEGQVPPLAAGDYVQFEVSDNGSGIKPEHLQKIFDAFFTTKKHGTGLGLATVLSIVRKHGGQIGVESVLNSGTTFTVFLPRADRPVEVRARRAPSLRFGTGRILLMDDDPKISALTGAMLQSLDYKYDLAKNGEEAIALYKRYLNIGRPYDVVILDITVIGGMGGEECFRALRQLDPEVRAVVSTGYDNDDMNRRLTDMGFLGYLTKPYRVTDLGKVIKGVVG